LPDYFQHSAEKRSNFGFGFTMLNWKPLYKHSVRYPRDSDQNIFSYLRLRPGDEVVRSYDKEGDCERDTLARRATDLSEYVHAVIFVVDANDPHLKDGKYRDKHQRAHQRAPLPRR